MASALKMEFCDWVSRRKLITPEQYRQVQSVCEAEPSRDSGEVLLELGYITPEEYEQTIRHISGVRQSKLAPKKQKDSSEDNVETELDNRAILRERGILPQDEIPTELNVSLFRHKGPLVTPSDASTMRFESDDAATIQFDSNDEVIIPAPHDAPTVLDRTPEPNLNSVSSSVNRDPVYARHYTTRAIIGRGGLGRVLLGFDRSIGREVAIKEILPEKLNKNREKVLARFLNEAKITGQLEHPGIVPVYELGVKPDGSMYYIMRYLRGNTLEDQLQMIQHQKLKPQQALAERLKLLDALIDVCDAMGYAHAKGFIHRDLKPANFVRGQFGETVILDWGLAKRNEDGSHASSQAGRLTNIDWSGIDSKDSQAGGLTVAGEILGTPAYMAPEQVSEVFGAVDQYSDVYALGVILFEILTGQTPYCDSPNVQTILRRVSSKQPSPSPVERLKHLPPELVAICRKAMSKYKVERFANAHEMAEELRAFRDGRLVNVYAYSGTELLSRFIDRHKYIFLILSVVIVALLTASIFSLNSAIQTQQSQDELIDKNRKIQQQQDEIFEERHRAKAAELAAQNALQNATAQAKQALSVSSQTMENLQHRLDELRRDLEDAAILLQDADFSDPQALASVLAPLQRKYNEAMDFAAINTEGAIVTIEPAELFDRALNKDVSNLEHIKRLFETKATVASRIFESPEEITAISLAAPVIQRGEVRGAIYALLRPDVLLPLVQPKSESGEPAMLWAMQENGSMLHDPQFPGKSFNIGVNIFFDEAYQRQPGRVEFARGIQSQPYGVSGYLLESPDGDGESTYHIAAWQTFQYAPGIAWKIVVLGNL